MGLAEQLRHPPAGENHVKCSVRLLRETLEGEDLNVLDDTMAKIASIEGSQRRNGKTGMTVTWLVKILTENGHKMSKSVMNRHLNGECNCGSFG
jgi:hypothetical protein